MTGGHNSEGPASCFAGSLEPQDQIDATVEALHLVGQAYRKFFHRQRMDDLSPQEFSVMHHLAVAGEGGASPSALGDALHIARPNITSLIRKLKDRGFVELARDPNDRRGRVATLTEQGAGYLIENRERLRKKMKEDFKRLSEDEQRRLESLAREMASLLERAFE